MVPDEEKNGCHNNYQYLPTFCQDI